MLPFCLLAASLCLPCCRPLGTPPCTRTSACACMGRQAPACQPRYCRTTTKTATAPAIRDACIHASMRACMHACCCCARHARLAGGHAQDRHKTCTSAQLLGLQPTLNALPPRARCLAVGSLKRTWSSVRMHAAAASPKNAEGEEAGRGGPATPAAGIPEGLWPCTSLLHDKEATTCCHTPILLVLRNSAHPSMLCQ